MNIFTAYEPTVDDVAIVLSKFGSDCSAERAEALFDEHIVGDESVPEAALAGGTDLDEQTAAANQEIARILMEAGALPNAALCAVCRRVICVANDAHLHMGIYIGDCCWDERLRTTE